MSINMLNKESALFRSISSVSLSLFPHCYSLTHWTFTCLTALSTNFYLECVRLTEQYYFIFPRLSKVRSILHHGLVGPVQNKNTNLCFHILFCHLFHLKICVFIIFISFFFFFLMKYQISATEYWPIRNRNSQSKVVSGTVCLSTF